MGWLVRFTNQYPFKIDCVQCESLDTCTWVSFSVAARDHCNVNRPKTRDSAVAWRRDTRQEILLLLLGTSSPHFLTGRISCAVIFWCANRTPVTSLVFLSNWRQQIARYLANMVKRGDDRKVTRSMSLPRSDRFQLDMVKVQCTIQVDPFSRFVSVSANHGSPLTGFAVTFDTWATSRENVARCKSTDGGPFVLPPLLHNGGAQRFQGGEAKSERNGKYVSSPHVRGYCGHDTNATFQGQARKQMLKFNTN